MYIWFTNVRQVMTRTIDDPIRWRMFALSDRIMLYITYLIWIFMFDTYNITDAETFKYSQVVPFTNWFNFNPRMDK